MMEFIALLSQFGNLDQHQIELIVGKSTDLYKSNDLYKAAHGKSASSVRYYNSSLIA